MKSILKQLFSFILPISVIVIVPWLIEDNFSIKVSVLSITGIIVTCAGLVLMMLTISMFIRIGKGTLAPWSPTLKLILTSLLITFPVTMENPHKIEKERYIEASTQQVWNILTNPDHIEEWLFGTRVITDWKPGSEIIFSFTWNGKEYNDKGTVLEFEPEKRFSYNYWSELSGIPDETENYSIITFELSPGESGTLLKLTHTNIATEMMYQHSNRNWDEVMDIIQKMLMPD